MTNSKTILYFQTTREASDQNEERALLFTHEFKITIHNYKSTILSTYPSKSSTKVWLVPSNPQQIYNSSLKILQQIYNSSLKILQQILDEIFSPHLHDLLLEVYSHLED